MLTFAVLQQMKLSGQVLLIRTDLPVVVFVTLSTMDDLVSGDGSAARVLWRWWAQTYGTRDKK